MSAMRTQGSLSATAFVTFRPRRRAYGRWPAGSSCPGFGGDFDPTPKKWSRILESAGREEAADAEELPARGPPPGDRAGALGDRGQAVAKTFAMSDATIYNWLTQDRIDRGEAEGATTSQQLELAAARRRIRQLETELAVARKINEVFLADGVAPKGSTW